RLPAMSAGSDCSNAWSGVSGNIDLSVTMAIPDAAKMPATAATYVANTRQTPCIRRAGAPARPRRSPRPIPDPPSARPPCVASARGGGAGARPGGGGGGGGAAGGRGTTQDGGRATKRGGAAGAFRYEAVPPGPPPGPPPHLHVKISAPGHRTLVTQVYPGDG